MKKSTKLLLALVLLLFSQHTFAQISGSTFAEAKRNGSGEIVYVYTGVSGFIENNENGNVTGLLVDLMDEFKAYIQSSHGIELQTKFEFIPEKEFNLFMEKMKVAKGGVFGLGNVSINKERQANYDFSPPFLDNVSLIITNNKVRTLSSYDELVKEFSNKKVLTVRNSTYHKRVKEIKANYLPNVEVEFHPSGDEVLARLFNSTEVFAVLDLNYYLESLQKRNPIKRHAAFDIKDDQFGIIMPKGNDWTPIINDFFNSGFMESSTYSQIVSNNLGGSALRLLNSLK